MEAVRNLIERHVGFTGSPRGQWILENWSTMLPKFLKVFPQEYKRVMGVPRPQEVVKAMAVKGVETTQEARA
jgi:glutamate synthase domain-containing protein 3